MNATNSEEMKVRVDYSKTCQARYIAHLDTIDVINKALRRLQLPYALTQGCHVRPKIIFGPPLPLGHASFCEYFILSLTQTVEAEWLQNALNKEFPQGMRVSKVTIPYSEKKGVNKGEQLSYQMLFADKETAELAKAFLLDSETVFEAERKGQKKKYRLGDAVKKAEVCQKNDKYMLEAEFVQGLADIPSVSKIVTALAKHLGDSRDSLQLIERIALSDL